MRPWWLFRKPDPVEPDADPPADRRRRDTMDTKYGPRHIGWAGIEWLAEDYDRALEEAPVLPKREYAPFSGDPTVCPKCAFAMATTQHHVPGQTGCSVATAPWINHLGGMRDPQALAAWKRANEAVGEHLDRKCLRCGYEWAEALAPGAAVSARTITCADCGGYIKANLPEGAAWCRCVR